MAEATQERPARERPVFHEYTLEQLADATGLSVSYIAMVRDGYQPLRPGFMVRVAKTLHRPEAELFGEA